MTLTRCRSLALALLAALAVAVTVPADSAAAEDGAPLPLAADASVQGVLGAGGAWCWFSDPRSVHVVSPTPRTFTGWIDSNGRIVVSAYDHETRALKHVTVMSFFVVDDHNNPSLLAHPDGNVSVFWSGHNGTTIWIRTTTRPGDITSFGAVRALRNFAPGDRVTTYTNPVRLPGESGRIYLFFRSGHTHQAFVTSDDEGVTWSDARVLVEQPGHRPYVKYDSDGDRTIAFAYTDGHPDEIRSSLYYSAMRDGQLLRADGATIGRVDDGPPAPGGGDLLWDAKATGVSAWVHDVALDANRWPVVVFATLRSATDHRYHYARYDGTAWRVQEIALAGGSIASDSREPSYSAGITLDHEDPSTVYLARPSADPTVAEIERWRTPDAGASWTAEAITQNSPVTNVRPISPRGLPDGAPLQAVWMFGAYPYFTTFRTSLSGLASYTRGTQAASALQVGASGTVTRPGNPVRLTGRLVDPATDAGLEGRELTLVSRVPGLTTWHRVEEARTDVDGTAFVDVAPTRSTEYAFDWPGDDSLAESRSPAALLSVLQPTAVRISGPTAPVMLGSPISIHARLVRSTGTPIGGQLTTLYGRRTGTLAWTTLATRSSAADGLVTFRRLLQQPTDYRVGFAGQGTLLPSTSGALTRRPVAPPISGPV